MKLRILVLLVLSGCASYTRLPKPQRVTIEQRYRGRVVELRQSVYYGALYDENQKLLLSPYPFAETYHLQDLDGRPIHPKMQKGVIPAATRMTVLRIEFPDALTMAGRLLTTPRYNPWVYLQVAPGETRAPASKYPYIVVLPLDLDTEAQVEAALSKVFGAEGDISGWMAQRKPTVRVAIEHKDVVEGMSLDEVIAAIGQPIRWLSAEEGVEKIAWYPSREVWFVGDKVKIVKAARALGPNPPPTTAVPATNEPDSTRS